MRCGPPKSGRSGEPSVRRIRRVTDTSISPAHAPEPQLGGAAAQLSRQYVPAEVEGPLYETWVQRGYFESDPAGDKPAYTIVIPPPNVTGSLHLGHALDHTLIDSLTRRARMRGFDTLWIPGLDHAGIATQNAVEREIAKEGLSRHDLG